MNINWNMPLVRGDRWPAFSFDIVDENGQAITPASVKMEVRKSKRSESVDKTLTLGNGFTLAGNVVTFSTNVDLEARTYIYDIEVTLSNGHPYTIFQGVIDVQQDITQ